MDVPQTSQIIKMFEKRTAILNGVITVIMPIALCVVGFQWYMQNIWEPTITVDNVDFENGTATVTINGKVKPLYAGSTLDAKYGWGVKFGGRQFNQWERIEVIKNNMTRKTLSTK